MKYVSLVLAFLLLMILGCSDENLVGVEVQEEPLVAEITPSTDVWIEGLAMESLHTAKMEAALASGDMVLEVGGYTFAPDPTVSTGIPCLDADGNPVPDLVLPGRFTVEGRSRLLGWVTGYFGEGECLVNTDFSLTVTREWHFTGNQGDALFGTYVTTTLPDGSFKSVDVITGGLRRFVGATGWSRSIGTVDLTTGTGTLYTKGLVSAPQEIAEMGFVSTLTAVSESGSIPCLNSNGDTVFVGDAQFEAEGLATYLGEITAVIVNDRCTSDRPNVLTFYGTWTYTNAQGDGLQGTHKVVVGVSDPSTNIQTITGGAGRFEGATGWMQGTIDFGVGIWVVDNEGVIYMPR